MITIVCIYLSVIFSEVKYQQAYLVCHHLPSPLARAPSPLGRLLIRLGLIDKVLHDLVQIRVLPGEQEHIICRDGCATSVVAKRLQVGGHIF